MTSQSLGDAVLTLDADQGPLNSALGVLESTTGAKVSQIGSKLSAIFGSSLGAGVAVGAAAVVVGAGLAAKALYDLGSEFDAAYDRIRVGTGATGAELEALKGDFKDVVSSVPTDFKTAADAITMVNQRLGLTGGPLRTVTKQMLELSRITGTDLGENVESVTRLFGDWGVKNNEMAPTLDKVYRLSQNTGIGVSDLSRYMVQFGSPLRQLGFDFETAAAMFGRFEKEGVNIQAVMPGLKMGLKNLSKPTGDAADVMERLGITSKDPAKGLQQTMDAIKGAGSTAEANEIAFAIFGARAGPDLAAAIREGRFELGDYLDVMKNGKDTIQSAARDTNDAGENFKVFSNKVKVALEPVATFVHDTFNSIVTAAIDFMAALSSGGEATSGMQSFVSDLMAVLTPLGGFLSWLAGIWKAELAGILQAFKGTFDVIVGIAKIVTGLLTLNFGQVWEGIKQVFSGVGQIVVGIFRVFTAAIVGLARGLWSAVTAVWAAMKSAASSAWAAIKSAASSAWSSIKATVSSAARGAYDAVKSAFSSMGDAVSKGVSSVVSLVRSLPGKIKSAIGDLGSLLYAAGKAVIQGLIDGIEAMLGSLWGKVKGIAGKIKSLKGPLPHDLKLLQPEGAAIIEGLGVGMDSQLDGVHAQAAGIAPSLRDAVLRTTNDLRTTAGNESELDRLAAAIDRLVSSGAAGVVDALMELLSERMGYDQVARRGLTAGDGTVALP